MENPTITATYTVTLPNQIKIFVHLVMREDAKGPGRESPARVL